MFVKCWNLFIARVYIQNPNAYHAPEKTVEIIIIDSERTVKSNDILTNKTIFINK